MKNIKTALKVLLILVLGLSLNASYAQTENIKVEVKKKEKKITIRKVKEVDGEKIAWDTTLVMTDENKEEVEKYLKEHANLHSEINFKFDMLDEDMKDKAIWHAKEHKHHLKELHKDGNAFAYFVKDGDSTMTIDIDFDHDFEFDGENEFVVDVRLDEDGENHMIWIDENGKHKNMTKHFTKKGDKKGNIMFFGDDAHSNFSFDMKVDSELTEADFALLKKAGVKLKAKELSVNRLRLTYEDDSFGLVFKLKSEGKATIKVVDSNGAIIFNDKVQYFPGTYHKSLDLNSENTGSYLIYIEQGGAGFSSKINLN